MRSLLRFTALLGLAITAGACTKKDPVSPTRRTATFPCNLTVRDPVTGALRDSAGMCVLPP